MVSIKTDFIVLNLQGLLDDTKYFMVAFQNGLSADYRFQREEIST